MSQLTYKGRSFYLDGEPFQIISGAMHYFRIPREYWRDRLTKLKECGFNTVETYTCWNLHEPREGVFDFSGMLDLNEYLRLATELGLYIILRPGPYICAEWELGGLPAWLLTYEGMALRCMDELYLSKVRRYYTELLTRIRHHFSGNGGNIIMLQVENEYGSYGDDKDYLCAVRSLYEELGCDCLYFTSDGPTYSMIKGGTLPDCLSVANFGSKPAEHAETMFELRPDQPFMCGEYWNGWFDHWGDKHHTRPTEETVEDFATFVNNGWSVNVYMFHGGTNFGFMNGANFSDKYQPTVTSYDYGTMLTEWGDRNRTYYEVRDILVNKFGDKVPPITAKDAVKRAYGRVELTEAAPLFDNLDRISHPLHSAAPKYMEELGQSYGYVLYSTTVKGPANDWALSFDKLHDRALVYVDGVLRATYMRSEECNEPLRLPMAVGEEHRLDVLVENMGRINYGPKLLDRKGAVGIRFGNQYHFGWDIYPLPMAELGSLSFLPCAGEVKTPTFLRGYLDIEDEPCDTFIRADGFTKGFVTVNGFNLGRYWRVGPTKTLYVPAPMLKKGRNEILVFESDGATDRAVVFTDTPDLG